MAWRFATWPTRRSPVLVKATTEGVVRLPSALGMTCGSPPSMPATHEFVVPRSMPIIFPITSLRPSTRRGRSAPPLGEFSDFATPFQGAARVRLASHLDRDLASLGLLGLGYRHLEHPVAVRRLNLVGLDRVGQRERTFEGSVDPLEPVIGRVLLLLGPGLLPPDDEPVVLEGDLDVLE